MSQHPSPRFLLEQGGVIGAFVSGAARSLLPRRADGLDHSEIVRESAPPSLALQQAYAEWAGARPGRYDGVIPPHLVNCQIALPVISALTARSPYPLLGVLNQGIHLALHAPLPATERLVVRGHLVEASDDGSRARIHSTLSVGTASAPQAMTLDAYAAVVLGKRKEGAAAPREAIDFRTIAQWQAAGDEGRKFFYLTGDFNPIHTWPAFARRTSFKGCIMHGYGAFAQVFEAIRNAGWNIADIDVKFVKPLPLPSPEVLIQVSATPDVAGRHALRLVDAAGNLYQVGSFRP
ncbi:MAG: MaoC family dehydratase [Pseudomonadota bacterium]